MASPLYEHFNTKRSGDHYLGDERPTCCKGLLAAGSVSISIDADIIQIWEQILCKNPQTELTEKQIYTSWAHINENTWRLNDEQVKSAQKILENHEGNKIEIVPIHAEDGISVIAFGFKEIVDDYGKEITKIAMDSTCLSLLLSHCAL